MRTALAACAYGNKYAPLLLSFLETWGRHFGEVHLACAEIAPTVLDDLARAYPSVQIMRLDVSLSRRSKVRISQKLMFWEALCERLKAEAVDNALFADLDTIALQDPRGMSTADVVLTKREPGSKFYLNTGVVSLSRRAIASSFVKDWRRRTDTIIADAEQLSVATSREHPFGGGDQMAVMQLLRDGLGDLTTQFAPCEVYNACGRLTDLSEVKVLHLKGPLHAYLLDGRPLIGGRRLEHSHVQISAAFKANRAGRARLADAGVPEARLAVFDFRPPFGVREDFTSSGPVTLAHHVVGHTQRWLGRARRKVLSGS